MYIYIAVESCNTWPKTPREDRVLRTFFARGAASSHWDNPRPPDYR